VEETQRVSDGLKYEDETFNDAASGRPVGAYHSRNLVGPHDRREDLRAGALDMLQ
jgi:hypothetical protein